MMNIDPDNWPFKLMRTKVDETFRAFDIQMEYDWYRYWYQFWHDAVTHVDEEHVDYHDTNPEMCDRITEVIDAFTDDGGVFTMINALISVAKSHVSQTHENILASNNLIRSTQTGVTQDMHSDLDRLRETLTSSAHDMNNEAAETFGLYVDEVSRTVEMTNALLVDHFRISDKKQSYEDWRDGNLRNLYQSVYINSVLDAFLICHQSIDAVYETLQNVYEPEELQFAYEMAKRYTMAMLFIFTEVHNLSLKTVDLMYPALTREGLDVIRVKSNDHVNHVMGKVLGSGNPIPPILTDRPISREVCEN